MPLLTRLPCFLFYKNFSFHPIKYFSANAKTQVTTNQMQSFITPELKFLQDIFCNSHYELRIVGGAVRDLLLKKPLKNLDLVTSASFEQMKSLLLKEKVRVLNISSQHGVIFVRVNDKENYPIKACHSNDWMTDANHRDFTINSLYLDFSGNIYDFTNGLIDLEKRRIIFVGNCLERIKEDPIRIIRYFRFFSNLSEETQHDAAVLDIFQSHSSLLKSVPGQVIWRQFKKILHGKHAVNSVKKFMELGLGKFCGFPEKPKIHEFEQVWQRSIKMQPELVTVISSFFTSVHDIKIFDKRLIISSKEATLAKNIVTHRNVHSNDSLQPYQNLTIDLNCFTAKEIVGEILKYQGNASLYEKFIHWNIPKFPVTSSELITLGIKDPALFKNAQKELQTMWKQSNFTASKDELMQHLMKNVVEKHN